VTVPKAFELALQQHQAGRLAEAEALYRQILAADPRHADALHLMGVVAHQVGQNEVAVGLIRQAIALKPHFPEAHYNLGNALCEKGCVDEAIAAYSRAIALQPNFPESYYNLGNGLRGKGRVDEAIAAYGKAIVLRPNYSEAYSNLGVALSDRGQLDEAIAASRQAIALRANYPEAYNNLGIALQGKGELDQAIAAYRQAIALHFNYAEAHVNLAFVLLVRGDFLAGWEEYEWRWTLKEAGSLQRNFTPPQWDGGPLEGRTLLLHAEQGLGDAIQFIRYLPRVAQGGGNIILECQPELERLFRRITPDLLVLARGQTLPAFDVHCSLLSLPRVFFTDLTNLPRNAPYLHADAADATVWRERLSGPGSSIRPPGLPQSRDPSGPDLKVGLVWAGGPTNTNDRNRSVKLASLARLAEVPGVRFISLQKGAAAAEARNLPLGMELIDVAEELKDFADTAALLANLDLVIAVDTAVVHLAGAMGRPVWTLLPFAPDWRWLLARSDSPWYPTMRLFRQPAPGDWDSVIVRVARELGVLGSGDAIRRRD